jgi:hypothetical protein
LEFRSNVFPCFCIFVRTTCKHIYTFAHTHVQETCSSTSPPPSPPSICAFKCLLAHSPLFHNAHKQNYIFFNGKQTHVCVHSVMQAIIRSIKLFCQYITWLTTTTHINTSFAQRQTESDATLAYAPPLSLSLSSLSIPLPLSLTTSFYFYSPRSTWCDLLILCCDTKK